MNFLAHLLLSHHNQNLLIGNFIADEVKGNQYKNYSTEIANGILMHRFIDNYTDTHQNVLECTKILRPHLSKFSPVALDIFFDYFLANQWQQHHESNLEIFTLNVYATLKANENSFPERSKYILKYMTEQNWLLSYADINGIKKILTGMSSRSKYGAILNGSEIYLKNHESELKHNFDIFFKELKSEIVLTDWVNL
jgi:acyl carrier protein phosphodiesterase